MQRNISGSRVIRTIQVMTMLAGLFFLCPTLYAETPSAASLQKTQTIFNNLNGVVLPQTNATIVSMGTLIDQGNLLGASDLATQDDHFISNSIFPFASVMTTRAENRNVPLNDFSATWMGYARDNLDLRGIFQNPVIYSFKGVTTAPAAGNNTHYVNAQAAYANQEGTANSFAKTLVSGSPTITVNPEDSAGVLSYARGYFWDFAVAGTNRKLFEESLREFLCVPLSQVGNELMPSDRIRQDVDPTSQNFQTKCLHCHAVQDANNAWNYFAFTNNATSVSNTSGQIAYMGSPAVDTGNAALFQDPTTLAATPVAYKVQRNNTVNPQGYHNIDNSWVNQLGSNNTNAAFLGLNSNPGGKGLALYGALIANSTGFQMCMAKRAFSQMCLRKDFNADQMTTADYQFLTNNQSTIQSLATDFAQNGYSLRRLFENTAIQPQCMGN